MSRVRVGLVCSRVRAEEKMLLESLRERTGVEVVRVDDDLLQVPLSGPSDDSGPAPLLRSCDVILVRALGHFRQLALSQLAEAWGVPVVNPSRVIETCGDKVRTTLALESCGVPTPPSRIAFTEAAALAAVEQLGYPCVVKPPIGSWGRLVARVNDRDSAEALLEHKALLGGALHRVIYLQAHVDKPGRDLRAFVIGGRTVAAIGRRSDHWVTNTARGARAERVEVTAKLAELCGRAAAAVGGGAVAVDLLEAPDRLLVNEVNATMEFRNSIAPTGVDIPGLLVDHTLAAAG